LERIHHALYDSVATREVAGSQSTARIIDQPEREKRGKKEGGVH